MILEVLFTSSVLIVGVICLRKLTMGKISMRFRYALWLLVAARLLLPVSVGTSPFSVLNVFTEGTQAHRQVFMKDEKIVSAQNEKPEEKKEDTENAFFAGAGSEQEEGEVQPVVWDLQEEVQIQIPDAASHGETANNGFSFSLAVGFLWLVGFLAVGSYLLFYGIRFRYFLRRERQEVAWEELPASFAGRLAEHGMRVYRVKNLPSPCLLGRSIYIGETLFDGTQELSHILAHEYCHARQGDGFWAFLRCALAAVYWFDPFVWVAVFAARQDSELACDEAAVRLLGEPQRFAYGRTLLSLQWVDGGMMKYPGMSPMLEGGKRSIGKRITALASCGKTKRTTVLATFAAACLICGCAFTGAETETRTAELETTQVVGMHEDEAGRELSESGLTAGSSASDTQERQTIMAGENNGEIVHIQAGYDESGKQIEEAAAAAKQTAEQEAERAAFEEVLNYHGIMEGKDDSELELNRKLDLQAYYDYAFAKDSKAVENPMENGWYLLFHNESEAVSLYGLYTEQFGFRGIKMKTMVGGNVNTWDIKWFPAYRNLDKDNIRVLERESNGLARRFVLQILEEDTSEVEIWRLYSGFQYDTGTIDMKMLEPEEYLAWAGRHLSFEADQEAGQIVVAYDGDTLAGALDISTYKDYEVEDVQINTDAISFFLDGQAYGKYFYDDYEGIVLNLAVGLKLKGSDEIWIDGLTPLTVQIVVDGNGNFKMQQPTTNAEPCVMRNLHQERRLEELPKR